jgi:hypothetical protein
VFDYLILAAILLTCFLLIFAIPIYYFGTHYGLATLILPQSDSFVPTILTTKASYPLQLLDGAHIGLSINPNHTGSGARKRTKDTDNFLVTVVKDQ